MWDMKKTRSGYIDVMPMVCRVVNQDPLVIWDPNKGVWDNVLANLGVNRREEIPKITDKECDDITDQYRKRLLKMRERINKETPDIMQQIEQLAIMHNPDSLGLDKFDFLPGEININALLATIDNHRATGKLSPLYYLLQYAAHQITDTSVAKFTVLTDRENLNRQIEAEELNALENHRKRSERVIYKQQQKKSADKLDVEAQLSGDLLHELNQDTVKRRKLMQLNNNGDVYKPANEVKRDSKPGLWGLTTSAFSAIATLDPREIAKSNYFSFLEDELVGKGAFNRGINSENAKVLSKIQSVGSAVQNKEKEIVTVKALIEACQQDLKELKKMEAPAGSVEVTAKSAQRTEILVEGKEKSFIWDEGVSVTDNVRGLVTAYLDNRDFSTTRARILSARRVLDEITRISEGKGAIEDPIRRDIALVKFLRKEKDTISVFGFNRKASKLHAIYRQAEAQLNNRIKLTIGEIGAEAAMKMHQENKQLKKGLEELKLQNQKDSTSLSELQNNPQGDVQPVAASPPVKEDSVRKTKELNEQFDQSVKDLHAQNASLFRMSTEEMSRMQSSEGQIAMLDKQRVELRRTLLVNEKNLAQAEERLRFLNLDEEQLGTVARIHYLEVSQLAKKLHREKDFNKVPDISTANPKSLMMSANSFLAVVAKDLKVVLPSKALPVVPHHNQGPVPTK